MDLERDREVADALLDLHRRTLDRSVLADAVALGAEVGQVSAAGLVLLGERGPRVAAVSSPTDGLDAAQIAAGLGPTVEVLAPDGPEWADARVGDLPAGAVRDGAVAAGVVEVVATRLVSLGHLVGALTFHVLDGDDPFVRTELVETFAAAFGGVLGSGLRRTELEARVEVRHRSGIEVGRLMARQGITLDEAVRRLRPTSTEPPVPRGVVVDRVLDEEPTARPA